MMLTKDDRAILQAAMGTLDNMQAVSTGRDEYIDGWHCGRMGAYADEASAAVHKTLLAEKSLADRAAA